MRPFIQGFADELVKLGAFPQQSAGGQAYEAPIASIMNRTQGASAKTGLKSGGPQLPAPAAKATAPTPLTTPNRMVGG